MGCLTKEQILAMDDRPRERVEVWGGYVNVATISGAERDQFEAWLVSQADAKGPTRYRNTRAKLVAMALVDDEGKRLFTDAEAEKLGDKNPVELDKLYDVARRLSGLGEKEVEELEKNSIAAMSGVSGSDSA